MAQVILTTASTSPWAVPGDFSVAGHTVILIGAGGNGAAATTGASSVSGGGGGGGACTKLVYSSGTITPGTTTIPFLIPAAGSANATQWQSSTAGSGAFYEALPGGNASGATAGAASGSTTTVSTPTITYTPTNHVGGAGGAGGGAATLGGGGGGGSGGTAAAGGSGATPTSTGGGGGGGGGAANNGSNTGTSSGGAGGAGATSNSNGGSGGAGGQNGIGSPGGFGQDFSAVAGFGGGGGGSGGDTVNQATLNTGGAGGNYGGGGGGQGCVRGTTTGSAGGGTAGLIVIQYFSTFEFNGVSQSWSDTPPSRARLRSQKAAALKGKSGFGVLPIWRNTGWEIAPHQPQHPAPERRAAAIMPRDDGAELTKINFLPTGFEIAPFQPSAFRAKTGGIMPRDDGTEFQLINWKNFGFEVQPFQPPPPYSVRTSPFVKAAALFGGDAGTELPMPALTVTSPWGFDPPPLTLSIKQMVAQRAAGLRGKVGFGVVAGTVPPPAGWEIAGPMLRPTQFIDRAAAIMPSDSGTENVYQFFGVITSGWGFDPVLPMLRRPPRINLDFGDQGIENKFTPPVIVTSGWGFDPVPPTTSITGRVRTRAAGLRGKVGFGATAGGGGGNPLPPWVDIPYVDLPRAYPPNRSEAIVGYSGFAAFSTTPWVADQMPDITRRRRFAFDPTGNIDAKFTPPITVTSGWGFDPPQFQPPARRFKGGAIAKGDEGNELPLINFFPSGWHIALHQPQHPRPERSGAIMVGDQGTENVYTFVQLILSPWHDPWSPQPPHPRPERAGALVGGDSGIESPLVNFLPSGWPIAPHQPSHPRPERSGAIMAGDQGTEAPYVFVPLFLAPWGYDTAPVQPSHPRPERSAALAKGDDGAEGPLINFSPFSWPIAPVQPPHPKPERSGAIAASEPGIEAPYVFTASFLAPYALDATQDVRHPRPERSGAVAPPDQPLPPIGPLPWGFESAAVNYRRPVNRWVALARGQEVPDAPFAAGGLSGWEIASVHQRPPQRVHAALQGRWEIDAVYNFIPLPPLTGFITPPEFLVHKRIRNPYAALQQQDGGWFFPHFVSVFYATTIVTQASGITTVTAATGKTVVSGEPTGR